MGDRLGVKINSVGPGVTQVVSLLGGMLEHANKAIRGPSLESEIVG